MKANSWRARWSQQSVLLQFNTGAQSTTIEFDQSRVSTLSTDLARAVAEYESSFGTIWSERHEEFCQSTDARLFGSRPHISTPDGHRLYLLIKGLPLSGVERSFKMLSGQLLHERFLVGIDTRLLSGEAIHSLASKMGIPKPYLSCIDNQITAANVVHIGFENGRSNNIYKLYLEFPQAKFGQVDTHHPLYLGYKWSTSDNRQCASSHYEQLPPLSLAALLRKVREIYGETDEMVCQIAHEIIDLATHRVSAEKLLSVEVKDDNTSRISFDINLYPTALRVRDVATMLTTLGKHFGIAPEALMTLLHQTGDDELGHISGGLDRSGAAFLTIYHARAATSLE